MPNTWSPETARKRSRRRRRPRSHSSRKVDKMAFFKRQSVRKQKKDSKNRSVVIRKLTF